LEHTRDVFRLYHYGPEAKGVFRGDEAVGGLGGQALVCESIPTEDEWSKLFGLLIYNQDAYKDACGDWERYWTWRANRNEARWASEAGEKFDYDAKNLSHCMRLLWSGENLLKYGEPIVRFSGEKLEDLRRIRAGNLQYEEIMAKVEAIQANALEAVMLNEQGYVAECTGDNLFLMKNGKLLTPLISDGALDGITRSVIIEIAEKLGVPVIEKSLTRYDIFTADECFLTGTAAEVIPVVALDRRIIGTGKPGEFTSKFLAAFHELAMSTGTPFN
jgi:hypothetical protein